MMPFGQKTDSVGRNIDFDAVYDQLICPAIEMAGLQPLRSDEELAVGVINKPVFERLLLCECAVADLTTANANVFYQVGMRHAARPSATVLLFAEGAGQLPFDATLLRALPYRLDNAGVPADAIADRDLLAKQLLSRFERQTDSPLYQLLGSYPEVAHTSTDVFRNEVEYSLRLKKRLSEARVSGIVAIRGVEQELGRLDDVEAGVLVDLFLSYRAVRSWEDMIRLADCLPRPLGDTVMIQEQLALALNRAERAEDAERVLLDLIERAEPSSETYSILGRVYKDRWEKAVSEKNDLLAEDQLTLAIDAYRRGFETDIRDSYPGVNAVMLMELKDPPDPARERLLPVVRFGVERRITAGEPDYWDWATLLELAILQKDEDTARSSLANALAVVREAWEPETTARNLRLIREARLRRNDQPTWADQAEDKLRAYARRT